MSDNIIESLDELIIKAIIALRKNNKRPDEARINNFIDVFVEGCEVSDGLFRERMKYLEEIGQIYNKPSKHGHSFYVAEKQITQLTSSIDPTPKVNDFSKNALLTPPSTDPTPKPNGILTPKK